MNALPPKISRAAAYLVDLEVETVRTDAVQSFVKQETIFVELETTDGLTGLGYSYTIGTGGTAVLALLRDNLLPRLAGADARNIEATWHDLFASTRATTVGAITSLALAAVDTALWDLRCLRAGEPLWRLAGGYRQQVPLYDTEGGWLHLTTDQLVAGALASQKAGWPGVKLKVGKPRVHEDLERLRAVREAVGPSLDIMVDANQSMTYAEARRRAAAFEAVDLAWFEEPLPADDLTGHVRLAASTSIPIAVGESLYSVSQFREYAAAGAAGIIQVDVARVGGITPWLKVAHLAETFNLEVCPHFLMELHVSLAAAVPNGRYVEHIPQLRAITRSELEVNHGHAVAPDVPGLGIDWNADAIDDRRVG
ncbi:L-alanine-DL-glutamate epimerase-like enolase superfamily enzyme [Kribbella antiqua]|uniref:L-alanine-DL-glutamate epimerase-like enolase superfamily enzyme n=1 Tax=Kribbella antiqua TaxID=2512217 RepID=A0A4R2IPZ9_9ACTN|nr:mandelate racemase/muconate lactonizing enzyme family protein [Kribbella antiqua]TCO46396.1 L-alanine-DL-glutamate epimerase-like enolase superfamily enzyme [Kribbella antiqua]